MAHMTNRRFTRARCTIVIGPPAAGKTTWINTHAQPGDLIIDFDALTQALSGPHAQPWTTPSKLILTAVLDAREAAINTAFKHIGRQHNSWIIHACPTTPALRNYHHRGATIIAIDPGRDTVTRRITSERPPDKQTIADVWYDRLLPNYPRDLIGAFHA